MKTAARTMIIAALTAAPAVWPAEEPRREQRENREPQAEFASIAVGPIEDADDLPPLGEQARRQGERQAARDALRERVGARAIGH